MTDNNKTVDSELTVKATANLQSEVNEELAKEDPSKEKAKGIIEEAK